MVDIAKLGRFDQSFVVKMIKDFFLLLLIVGFIEMGIRFAVVLYDFYEVETEKTRQAADRLASDVRGIMVNSGGPVAARTLYPILEDNHSARGFEIAIEPSAVTVSSIEDAFDYTPRGISANWSEGENHSYSIAVRAEEFCLSCHTQARAGDVLGTVTVRRYLSTNLEAWWKEVRLSGMMGLLKIVLDTTLLFFLLRARLEPVISLRTVVAGLAKGGSDLSFRAPVKSADEFGELASDLNRFLDRLTHILDDLRAVLARVAELNQRLETIHERMTGGFRDIGENLTSATREAFSALSQDSRLSSEWLTSVQAAVRETLAAVNNKNGRRALEQHLKVLCKLLTDGADEAGQFKQNYIKAGDPLITLTSDVRTFGQFMGELAILEEQMQAIAETGNRLLDRLIEPAESNRGAKI